MKIRYFEETDTLLIEFRDAPVVETGDLDENTILDVDKDGNICSITARFHLMLCRGELSLDDPKPSAVSDRERSVLADRRLFNLGDTRHSVHYGDTVPGSRAALPSKVAVARHPICRL
jgi:uncharacterized protein YuzE